MDLANLSPLMKLLVTAGVLYGAYKYGPSWAKGMALGAAGVVALNQIPIARDGARVVLLSQAAA